MPIQDNSHEISITQDSKKLAPEDIADDFIKNYLRINSDPHASFPKRMMLDIHKRNTVLEQLDIHLQKKQKKLPGKVIDERFDKLYQDSKRRKNVQQTNLGLGHDSSNVQPHVSSVKKLLPSEHRRVYDTNVAKKYKRDKTVLEQRRMKEFMEEISVLEQKAEQEKKAKEFFEKHNPLSTKISPRVVDRMDADTKFRIDKKKDIEKEKEALEFFEVSNYNIVNVTILDGRIFCTEG